MLLLLHCWIWLNRLWNHLPVAIWFQTKIVLFIKRITQSIENRARKWIWNKWLPIIFFIFFSIQSNWDFIKPFSYKTPFLYYKHFQWISSAYQRNCPYTFFRYFTSNFFFWQKKNNKITQWEGKIDSIFPFTIDTYFRLISPLHDFNCWRPLCMYDKKRLHFYSRCSITSEN